MKKINLFIWSVSLLCLMSCNENNEDIDKAAIKQTTFGELNVNIVDENGLIEKVFTKAQDMIDCLDGNYKKRNDTEALIPPPPPG